MPTVGFPKPRHKVLPVVVVLDHGGDRVLAPLEGEGVDAHVVVREPLHKVQRKHWRKAVEDKTDVCECPSGGRVNNNSLHQYRSSDIHVLQRISILTNKYKPGVQHTELSHVT